MTRLIKDKDCIAICLGLHLIRVLSNKGVLKVVQIRQEKQNWLDVHDFLKSNPLNRSDLTSLVSANALRRFQIPRSEAIWISEATPFAL